MKTLKVGDRLTLGRKVIGINFLPIIGNIFVTVPVKEISVKYLCIGGYASVIVGVDDGHWYYGYQIEEMLKVKEEVIKMQEGKK